MKKWKSITDNTSERSLSFADLIPKSQASIFTACSKNSSMEDNLPLTLPANIVAGCSFMICVQLLRMVILMDHTGTQG